jgi:hypothetical protein
VAYAFDSKEKSANFSSENLNGRRHFNDLDRDGKSILKWILNKLCEKKWSEFT